MKKIVAGVVVILVIAGIGMPFVNGMIVEKAFRRCIGEINSRNAAAGTNEKAEIVRYDRGFSSTEIEWRIRPGNMKPLYGVEEIVFIERAKHGYMGVISKTSLEKNVWYEDFVKNRLGGTNPLDMSTEYKLNGGIQSIVSVAAMSLQVEDEIVEVSPARIVLDYDMKFERFRTNASWEGFKVADKASMKGVSFVSDLTMISPFIWDGQLAFGIESGMSKEEAQDFTLEKLKGEYNLTYDKAAGKLAVEFGYDVGSMGDGLENMKNAAAKIGLTGLDAAAYEEAMGLYVKLVSGLVGELAEAENDPAMFNKMVEDRIMGFAFQMMAAYEKLLKQGLEISVRELRASLPQGDIKGGMSLRLEEDMSIAQMVPMLNQPELIFGMVTLNSDISLPIELVGDNPTLRSPIYPGMKTGLFVENGKNLVLKAETRDKKLFLNGEEMLFN
jgi:uncharacterized protein YdgA (DUF945 family)